MIWFFLAGMIAGAIGTVMLSRWAVNELKKKGDKAHE